MSKHTRSQQHYDTQIMYTAGMNVHIGRHASRTYKFSQMARCKAHCSVKLFRPIGIRPSGHLRQVVNNVKVIDLLLLIVYISWRTVFYTKALLRPVTSPLNLPVRHLATFIQGCVDQWGSLSLWHSHITIEFFSEAPSLATFFQIVYTSGVHQASSSASQAN